MAGPDPAIHHASQDFPGEMDCRVKPGNDVRVKSRQRPFQQSPDIVWREIDGAIHAGVIPGKARRSKQFGVRR